MEGKTKKYLLIGLVVVVVIIAGGLLYMKMKKQKEGFQYPDYVPYSNVPRNTCAQPSPQTYPVLGSPSCCGTTPERQYEMIDSGDVSLPDINTEVPMVDVDIADPQIFLWRPSARVQIKNRQMAESDPLRGDLPIQKNNCFGGGGWFSSRYNEQDSNLSGAFSEFTNAKFRALTGQQSYPMQVSSEELIMDSC